MSEGKPNVHDLDVTVWVGKSGIDAVIDELDAQLKDREAVKVRFHRAALAGTNAEELAETLAQRTDSTLVDVRGHTGVYQR